MGQLALYVNADMVQGFSFFSPLKARTHPDSKVHGANMGPTWVLSAPDGPMLAPWTLFQGIYFTITWVLATISSCKTEQMYLFKEHIARAQLEYIFVLSTKYYALFCSGYIVST